MAKQYTVKKFDGCGGLYAAVNHKGERVTPLKADESAAWLDGHHWSHAPTTFKRLGFKPAKTGSNIKAWECRPFWGCKAIIIKGPKDWAASVEVRTEVGGLETTETHADTFSTREAAADYVNAFGNDEIETRNILNPEAGPLMIARRNKGGCTDPGTETYHCM